MNLVTKITAAAALAISATGAFAEDWTLDGGASHLAFGSIKNDWNGEVHSFSGLSGSVSKDGMVKLNVDLATVETNIDIRNERMIEHVFKAAKSAEITAQIDMDEVKSMAVGDSKVLDVSGSVNVVGTSVDIDTQMFVMRIGEDKAMVATNGMVFLDVEEAGLNGGVDKLMELAGLDGITRSSPVTMRLMFDLDGSGA